ncbi:UDP-N-acetylglucosamine pyrophosphorylase [Tulasnella sp. JGI-2019a]|nr:UDP-N-acetylglucosamine pyrophosphorylase [Tulasnella sp. JGI-2019a]KAG8999790.1 UDP-N-acetylglucosamine pyrophosphorylase [Tulasnella sp. JGI-2019a]
MDEEETALKQLFQSAGQDHLFQFWPELSKPEQANLCNQLKSLDVNRVNRIWKTAVDAEKAGLSGGSGDDEEIRPLPQDAFDTILDNAAKEADWRKVGLRAVADGHVGVLLMAGGQGTRLGSSDPKGCYDIGLPSHKSLFQYQAERIARLQTIAEEESGKPQGSVIVPWYIMTSGPTRKPTVAFFEKNHHFGLDAKNVIFFEQGTLPCLTMDGKILLDSKSHVAVAPDGNGGLYAALRAPISPSSDSKHNVINDLESRGIIYVHAYGVDNCLVRVGDPVFIGYSISKQADCSAKVVRKTSPTESVGVVAMRGKRVSVVEYSEISKEQAEQKEGEQLAYRAANIVNHVYTTEFLKQVESFEEKMAFHIARKKIPHVDINSGEFVKPAKPNGMKLELFVFDVFPYAQHMMVLEVDRKEEFSPLKNAPGTGSDDPETSRKDLLSQQKRFLQQAGATVNDEVEIEVSPLASYAGEGLSAIKGATYTRSGIAESVEALDALK